MAINTVTTRTCDWCGAVISSRGIPSGAQTSGVAVTVTVKRFFGMLGSSTTTDEICEKCFDAFIKKRKAEEGANHGQR